MRPVFAALVVLCLAAAPASAQYGYNSYGYKPTYSYGSNYSYGTAYKPSYYTYPSYSHSYAPSYNWSYWGGGYDGPLWYPAGYYSKVNGLWYRQNYGYEYGSPYPPGAAHCPTPAPQPPAAPGPDDVLKELLIRRLLAEEATRQPQQPLVQQPPIVLQQQQPPQAGGLTPADRELLDQLRKILAEKK